jgi:hypothetical protein
MESLFAELASNGVLVSPPKVELADYLGGYSFLGATLEKAGIIPDPSLAQVRALQDYCRVLGACWHQAV